MQLFSNIVPVPLYGGFGYAQDFGDFLAGPSVSHLKRDLPLPRAQGGRILPSRQDR
jgi:hypothetical protein